MAEAQKWLTDNYENKKDVTIEIKFNKSKDIELNGKLEINDYPNLKDIFLVGAKGITELVINRCPNVEKIFVPDNQITKIEGTIGLPNLQKLTFGNNKVEKIDISKNENLEMITFFKNPENLEFVNGIKNLSKLVFWNSDETFAITKLLEQASGEDLKEIAGELKLDVGGKTPEEMKKIIKDEAIKIEQNKTKLNGNLPGLLDGTGKVDDKKLEEIKNNVDKGEKYQKLVDEPTNAPIVDADKKEIDQTKLTDQLGKTTDYEKLVNDNQDLVADDGKKIDQAKIDNFKNASGDAAAAIPILGVNDLKPDTLNAILGGSKLSDINNPETLKSILEKNKNLEDALKEVGINPNDVANMKDRLEKWKGLEEAAKGYFGANYESKLEVTQYLNQVEVITNK